MNNNPLVSIIVPIYKVEPFLNKCVLSILNQTYRNIEILLVDDGSPDKCPRICDEFAKKDNRIIVIHQNNMGLPYARKSGFEKSSGDYIYFVDSDDYIDKDCIKILVSHAQINNADITLSGINNEIQSEKRIYKVPRIEPGFYDKQSINALLSKDFLFNKRTKISSYPLYAWGKLIRKDVLDGYFEVSTQFHYWEDMPSTFYLTKKINSLEIVKENLYYYVIHPNQVTQKPIEAIWHYYVDVWNYLEKSDTDGFLKTQLPQRMWWVIMNGLAINIKNNSNFGEFKKIFQTIRETSIVKRIVLNSTLLRPLSPSYKILYYLFKKKYLILYYIIIRFDILSLIKNCLKLNKKL